MLVAIRSHCRLTLQRVLYTHRFVHDNDLSQLFKSVSSLRSVPACVIRKANMQSEFAEILGAALLLQRYSMSSHNATYVLYTGLRYGFVSFLTAEEKEVSEKFVLPCKKVNASTDTQAIPPLTRY